MHNDLKNYDFDTLTQIVKELIDDNDELYVATEFTADDQKIITQFTEEEIERIINQQDFTSKLVQRDIKAKVRIFDDHIQKSLKKLYQYRCQICGATATVMYGVDVTEAHHLDYFRKRQIIARVILLYCVLIIIELYIKPKQYSILNCISLNMKMQKSIL